MTTPMTANLDAFVQACRAKRLKPATREWYEWLLTDYCEYAEAQGLRWDAPDTLDAFFGEHLADRELSAYTVHAYYRALRRFFNWLEKRRRLPGDNPMRMVESPRLARRYPRGIEADDVERLLAAIDPDSRLGKRDRAIIMFLWDTGVRVSELCGLEMHDLNLIQRKALIRNGKGEKDRRVSFGCRAEEYLTAWLEVRGEAKCNNVFVSRDGKQLKRRGIAAILHRRSEKAGIEGPYNPHAFRHGFAMAFLDNGGHINNLQRLMGHATLRSTEVYVWSTDKRAHADHANASPGDHLNDS